MGITTNTHEGLKNTTGDLNIINNASNGDVLIKGNDGGSTITALELDMSDSGKAYFNSEVHVGGLLKIPSLVYHINDLDTYFGFTADNTFHVYTGSSERFKITGDVHVKGATDFAIPAGRKLYLDGQSNTYITESSADNIKFFTGGSEALLLDSSQNATFAGKVKINSVYTANTDTDDLQIGSTTTGNGGLSIITGNTNTGGIFFGDNDNNDAGRIKYIHSSNSLLFDTNRTNALTINSSQNATFAGTVTPSGNGAKDLGGASNRWATVYAGNINTTGSSTIAGDLVLDDHVDHSPNLYFYNQANNYARLYFDTNNDLIFKIGTSTELTLDGTSATFAGDVSALRFHMNPDYAATNEYLILSKGQSQDGGILLKSKPTSGSAQNDWQILNHSTTGDLRFYAYGLAGFALTLDRENGNATFAGSLTIPEKIIHLGDTNTYFGFDLGADTFRVVAGGTEKLRTASAGIEVNGELQADTLDIDGNADISGNITSAGWTGDVIASAYLDSDTAHLSVAQTFSAMKSFEVPLTDNDDWQSSPISILEKGNVNSAQSADKYAPNLNFHWGAVVSNSLWMGHNGHLNYGGYSSTGIPDNNGVFNVATVNASTFALDGNSITGIDDSDEFTDDDAHIMTSAAVNDRITSRISGLGGGTGNGDMLLGTAQDITADKEFQDGIKARFGNDADLQIYHNNTDAFINNDTGDLYIKNFADAKDIIFQSDNGTGGMTAYMTIDGSDQIVRVHKPLWISDYITHIGDTNTFFGFSAADTFVVHAGATGHAELTITGTTATFAGNVLVGGATQFLSSALCVDSGTTNIVATFKSTDNQAWIAVMDDDSGTYGALLGTDTDAGQEIVFANKDATKRFWINTSGTAVAASDFYVGNDLTVAGGDVTITKQNGSPTINMLRDANDPGANTLLHYLNFQVDYSGSHQDWGGIEHRTTSSSTRTKLNFNVKSTSGAVLNALSLDGTTDGTKATFAGDILLADNKKLKIGDNPDLQIYHNGSHSFIQDIGAGDLRLLGSSIKLQNTSETNILTLASDLSATFAGSVHLNSDSAQLQLGDDNDMQIFHNGANGEISNGTGDLIIEQNADDGDIIFKSDNGTGGLDAYLVVDGTQHTIDIFKQTHFYDNVKATFGHSNDLQLYHNGTDSFLLNTEGDLEIINFADDKDIIFKSDDGSGGVATYLALDGSDTIMKAHKSLRFLDNAKGTFGNSDDLQIYHDGNHSYMSHGGTGKLFIQQNTNDQDIVFQCDDGSGGTTEYFRLDGSATLINVSCANGMQFNDNVRIKVGSGSGGDLRIYHDGSNSYIDDSGTGSLFVRGSDIFIKANTSENAIIARANAAVELYHNNSLKLETAAAGVKTSYAATSSTDGDAAGDIVYFSETSTTAGRIYYYTSSGAWELADADAVSSASGMLAVALGSGSATHGMLLRGMVTLNHDPGAVGDTLFLSTAVGQATATAPSGTGDIVRVIGYCLHASNGQIYFNPDGAFVEVTAG